MKSGIGDLLKSVNKIQICLQSDRNVRYFMWTPRCILLLWVM